MNRFHVVAISKGYHLLASHPTFEAAAKEAMARNRNHYAIVMRDGTTGKRYSIAELQAAA